jgi:hypothetical protein
LDLLEVILINIVIVINEARVFPFGPSDKLLAFGSNGLLAVVYAREDFNSQGGTLLALFNLGKKGRKGISAFREGADQYRQVVVIDLAVKVGAFVLLPVLVVLSVEVIVQSIFGIVGVLMPYYTLRKVCLLSKSVGLVHKLVVAKEGLVGRVVDEPEALIVFASHTDEGVEFVSCIAIVEPEDTIKIWVMDRHFVLDPLVIVLHARDHIITREEQNVPLVVQGVVVHIAIDGINLVLGVAIGRVILNVSTDLVVVVLELVGVGRWIIVVEGEEKLGALLVSALGDILEERIFELVRTTARGKLNQQVHCSLGRFFLLNLTLPEDLLHLFETLDTIRLTGESEKQETERLELVCR